LLVSDKEVTLPQPSKFEFDKFPLNTLFHERRSGRDRRDDAPPQAEGQHPPTAPPERRERKERRRRIDPTTFDKQYTPDELEFMKAMQQVKVQTGRPFPTHREVIGVAVSLGYRIVA
jgi:hypothetical protein